MIFNPSRVVFLLLINLMWSSFTLGQNIPRGFSTEAVQFTADLGKYFETIYDKDKRKEARDLMESFTNGWKLGVYTPSQQLKIMEMANLMLKYKMKPIPHYFDYIQALTKMMEKGQDEKSFEAWFATLEKTMDFSSSRKFLAFLEISISLFTDNVLYSSNAVVWKSSSADFRFSYDSVPEVIFPGLNLICYANGDSSVIQETRGVYLPTQYLWVGEGGKVSWLRTGFAEDQVWAELGHYKLGVRYSKYNADSVTFYNKEYFDKPLLGSLEEKVLAVGSEERISYPRFSSYFVRLSIRELFKDIDYEGGFSMRGARLYGSGSKEADAKLFFKKDGKVFTKVEAKEFIIRKDRISSTRASITVYWEDDSIFHPGLEMKFLEKSRELSMLRNTEGLAMSPYFNTFHKIDMFCEAVYWKMDEPKIDFTMIKGPGGEGNALFESANYYRNSRYDKLQGMDDVNPLDLVMGYYRLYGTKEFQLIDFINYVKAPAEQVEAMLLRLSIQGFLVYDTEEDRAYIKDRLFEYLNARSKKTDYDVIQFNSTITAEPNATLSLLNFDLKLRGVSRVYLSDSQMVYLYPNNQELILKKNRDFLFSGRVHAGLFDFFAKDCSFEYDKFKLNMPTVDSLSFMVRAREKNDYGEYPLVRVKTVIRELSGDLLIDHPNNKSGLTSFKEYPIFNSKNDAYAFYDKGSIQKGVYKRSRFFYHVYPFSISNLDNFKTDELKFEGYLVSAGIFPDIEEPLRVQKDYSLGFTRVTSPGGIPVYGGLGTFFNIIDLSHAGLKGDGKLDYLVSVSESHDFTFYPDSLTGILDRFDLASQSGAVEYPTVKGEHVKELWRPYQDLLTLSSLDKPLLMFDGEVKMEGRVQLSSASLTGSGLLKVADAEIDAELFKFRKMHINSDTANFRLKTYDLKELAFSTHNYKSHIDFTERKGEFKSNGGGSKVDFPVNQYICFMDEFEWYMDKDELALSNSRTQALPTADKGNVRELVDIDISGSEFISVHPKQDSLRFFSPKARYNLRNNIIYAQEVSFIRVADAAVFPEKGKVTIFRDARMETLNNARLLANTVTKYHEVYGAVVDIQSRKSFTGVGSYDYVDDKGDKQLLYLDKIRVDSTLQTIAHSYVSDSSDFRLSEQFDFLGDIQLMASKEYLTFDGGYRIRHDCDTLKKAWVKFVSEVNPAEILLPVPDDLRDIDNRSLFASLAFSQRNNHIYSAFLTRKESVSDQEILSARGKLQYVAARNEYQIASPEKLKQRSLPGSFLSIDKNRCIVHGEGGINLGTNLGQVKMQSFGAVDYYMTPDSGQFDLVLTLDFYFADNAMKIITDGLKEANLMAVELGKDKYKSSLSEMLGVKDADALVTEISLYGGMKRIPSELNHTFVFADIMLKWNPLSNTYVSVGPIGIGNMEKNQINKFLKGYVEITKKRSGDILDMYLEVSENQWFYFNYTRGLMQSISSSVDYNTIITEMKADKRTQKGEKGEETYRYSISTVKKKKDFIRRMEGLEGEI